MDVLVNKNEGNYFNYQQPNFYRFTEDSILLAKSSIECSFESSLIKGLDLCAGTGIVGIEAMIWAKGRSHFQQKRIEFDFCELQIEFASFLEENVEQYFKQYENYPYPYRPKFYMQSFESLSQYPDFCGKYDLIVSNPPYFNPAHGRLSPENAQRNACRFFIHGTRESFFHCLYQGLKIGGIGLIVQRKDLTPLQYWEKAFHRTFYLQKGMAVFSHWKEAKEVVLYRFEKLN